MSDELAAEVAEIDEGEGQNEGQETLQDQTSDEVKELARKMGWSDRGKFGGDPDKYVDAATFIRNTHSINTGLRKQVKDITHVVTELKLHNERVYQAEVKKLTQEINELRSQRKSAIADGDVDRVEQIEQEIQNKHEQVAAPSIQKSPDEPNLLFEEWAEDNQWYRKDQEMREFADKEGLKLKGRASFDVILETVTAKVQAKFPEKFVGKAAPSPQKQGASPVEGGSRRPSSSKTFSKADLNYEQRTIMKQFAAHNVMTEAAYIADLVKRGDIS